ncbi:hypothetical protein J5J10_11635 [Ciceribacter sp. L1K23]|uniref:DUF4344 domain-containing metallopeptidase n=1 Tax=Ciceribacter sp. L1K23 TaxID=2820276 RepID=UPI001B827648|nr:DUF4344 domain-containing metallopeptidase [Ciceribacter sp. L1K23]MBR0556329.1 hypothetical protein [Ciceribacter sp. L1K23]
MRFRNAAACLAPVKMLIGATALSLAAATAGAVEPEQPELYAELWDEQIEEANQFVINTAIATVFHEAGHMLVSELSLPVLGREEDAVDGLATILLLEAEDEELNVVVEDWANVWFLTAGAADEDEELAFWDTHGLDEQRAYNTICMMMGKNRKRFEEFADSVEFPDYRKEQCVYEYEGLRTSWGKVLEPHKAGKGDSTAFKIEYKPTTDPHLAYFRDMIVEAGLLEMVRDVFSGTYKLKDGIRLTATECGVANAFWSAGDREMTLCYEDLLNSANLDAQWYIDNPDEDEAAEGEE